MKVSFKGRIYDLQDFTDLWDEYYRTIEKLEKKLAERENDIGEYIIQLEIKDKEIKQLKAHIETLERG